MKEYLSLLIILCVAIVGAGQKPTDKKPKKDPENLYPQLGAFTVKANLLALDAENKYVEALKPEDIKLFEDGVQQKITQVETKLPPLHLTLLVDNSGSLRQRIGIIVAASKVLISNLEDGDRASVMRFVSSDKVEVLQDFTPRKDDLLKAVSNMYVEGGQSAVLDAVYLSAERTLAVEQKLPRTRYAIILISDGEDRASYYDVDQTLKILAGSRVQIFPLFFTDLLDKKNSRSNSSRLAHLLALRTGGTAQVITEKLTGELLENALKSIITDMRSQFVISYDPTNQKRDGLERKLNVEIADGANGTKRKGMIRPSFVIPLDQ
jgi:Ca-activated chloride channel homolog